MSQTWTIHKQCHVLLEINLYPFQQTLLCYTGDAGEYEAPRLPHA